jgi:hypothetical protein
MTLTQEEYDTLEEAEYMIDDILITATPITFKDYKEKHNILSDEHLEDTDGYDVAFNDVYFVFMPRELFESISIKSEY